MKDTFELYNLHIEVTASEKPMVCSHTVGDYFEVQGENIVFTGTKQFSLYALAALLPLLPAKQRQTDPNDWMSTDAIIACPDPNCGGQFKITRGDKMTFRHSEVTVTPLQKE